MLLKKVLMTLLFYFDTAFSEEIEIGRFIQDKWWNVNDFFNIPHSVCNDEDNQYRDYCSTVCNVGTGNGNPYYSCSCPDTNSTITYDNNQWRCRGNAEVRKQLGCEINNLFVNKADGGRLRTLNTFRVRKTRLPKRINCAINVSTSWYIECHGKQESLEGNTNDFRFNVPGGKREYHLKNSDNFITNCHTVARDWKNVIAISASSFYTFYYYWAEEYRSLYRSLRYVEICYIGAPLKLAFYFVVLKNSFPGRIINLGISCTSGGYMEGCLLFKLEGNISCAMEEPRHTSSIAPTATSAYSIATKLPTSTQTRTISRSAAQPKTSPSQVPSQPSSGSQQKRDDATSSSPVGVVTGVTVSIVTVLLLIAALFFYRRHKSRKNAHTSTTSQSKKEILERTPETNAAFQSEEQNGYVTCKSKKPGDSAYGELYASLDVPEGHNIYGPANAQEPFYNVLQGPSSGNEEDGQNYGTIRLEQPMYNVLEDLSGMGPGKDEEGGPNRVEPVYNVLEETYPGNAERSQHYGAISVNDPFYNTLEETQGKSGPQGTNDEPVYNTLEEPYPSGAAEDDSYGPRGVQDPVYNVLEGPGTDKIDSNTPTYAVVNKKR